MYDQILLWCMGAVSSSSLGKKLGEVALLLVKGDANDVIILPQ